MSGGALLSCPRLYTPARVPLPRCVHCQCRVPLEAVVRELTVVAPVAQNIERNGTQLDPAEAANRFCISGTELDSCPILPAERTRQRRWCAGDGQAVNKLREAWFSHGPPPCRQLPAARESSRSRPPHRPGAP